MFSWDNRVNRGKGVFGWLIIISLRCAYCKCFSRIYCKVKFDWKKVLRDNFLSFLSSGAAWIDLKSSAALFEHSTCPVKHMTETGEHGVKNICSEFCFTFDCNIAICKLSSISDSAIPSKGRFVWKILYSFILKWKWTCDFRLSGWSKANCDF